MIGKQPMSYIIFGFCVLMVASFVGNKIKQKFQNKEQDDDYELIKKYLLNDSTLYGNNRPKIWIHSEYEINARKWKNFMSRNTTDLNQPYLYLTIQSIINHCGDDFHICLIDDDSFEKLIPSWTINLADTPEPMRSKYRDIAMLQLLYIYGGFRVPNSFLCNKNIIELYKQGVQDNKVFIAEKRSNYPNTKTFVPDIQFIGSQKENAKIQELIQTLTGIVGTHFQNDGTFLGTVEKWCQKQNENQEMNLLDGKIIGIKTSMGKPVLLDHLMNVDYIDYDNSLLYGIYIPRKELLRRPKYQYFAILPVEDVLETDSILSKYFKISMVDGVDQFYKKRSKHESVVSL
jgi:hypothetical protein